MRLGMTRRSFLGLSVTTASGLLSAACASPTRHSVPRGNTAAAAGPRASFDSSMSVLERRFGRRIGVAAIEPATGRRVGHRADERFLHCSTAKVVTVASVLARVKREPNVLTRRVQYDSADLVAHSPVTGEHVAVGMTVEQLCVAALTVSDNTAENLLLRVLGGPAAVTRYVRSLGDTTTRLDRAEPALNERSSAGLDTTTPAAMAHDLRRLILEPTLEAGSRARLTRWMKACTTGDRQIRAGVPAQWTVADKTGSGDHAESNDIAVIWSPMGNPIALAVYTDTQDDESATGPDAIAATTRAVLVELGVRSHPR